MKKLSFFIILIFLILPAPALAALNQPAGQYPITEPLQPIDVGNKPNYSGNIQFDDPGENSPAPANDLTDDQVGSIDTTTAEKSSSEGHNWIKILFGFVVLVVITVVGLMLWRNRKTAAIALLLALVIAPLLILGSNRVLAASSPPPLNPSPRRVILEEDQITPVEPAKTQASHSVLYGLAAIVLIIVAIIGAKVFMDNSSAMSKPKPKAR
jgi:hypothetical protein